MNPKARGRFWRPAVHKLPLWTLLATGMIVVTGLATTLWPTLGDAPSFDDQPFSAVAAAPTGNTAQPLGEAMGIQVQPWYIKPGDLQTIYGVGFRNVRWGVAWERVETVPGQYDWRDMDRFLRDLSAARLRSVIILGYGNPLYTDAIRPSPKAGPGQLVEARPPLTDKARAAFARFAAAAAARYRTEPIIWEIWNEPDSQAFWQPKPDPAAYAALAKQSCTAIRAAVPDAKILGGVGAALPNAVAGQSNIYGAIIQNGAMACLNGVSAHAYRMSNDYRQPDPESIIADIEASRSYLYSKLKMPKDKVFAVTEWGFTTHNVSPNVQAAYLVRSNLVNAAMGVPLTIWYEWRDSRPDRADPESHFGLLTTYGGPKNTRNVHLILSRIADARFVKTVQTNRADAYALQFRGKGTNFLVAWKRTYNERDQSSILINGTRRAVISFMPAIIELREGAATSVVVE